MATTRKPAAAATKTQPAARKPAAAKKAPSPAPAAAPKKREKLVRDSFTIPKPEYAVLSDLKQRAAKLGHAAKKSELLRAGIKTLSALANASLLAALRAVPSIKTGRPATAKPPRTMAAARKSPATPKSRKTPAAK